MSKRLNTYKADRRPGTDYRTAVWERDVKRQAFRNWRWLIYGPVAAIFFAGTIVVLFK